MQGESRSLLSNSRAGWAPRCHVKQCCCLLLQQIQFRFSSSLTPLLFLSFSCSSDQRWYVVCLREFWTCCGKVWGPDGGVEAGDFEAGKYIGYEIINLYWFLNRNPSGYGLTQQANHCRRPGTWNPHNSQKILWQDHSLNLNVTLSWTQVQAPCLMHASTVQCTKCTTSTSPQQILLFFRAQSIRKDKLSSLIIWLYVLPFLLLKNKKNNILYTQCIHISKTNAV